VEAGPRLRDRQPGTYAEGAAFDGRCDGGTASGREWQSVHGTTLDTLREHSRGQVGPQFCSTVSRGGCPQSR
jgi:hypothetical protein